MSDVRPDVGAIHEFPLPEFGGAVLHAAWERFIKPRKKMHE
ncbi:hypothetical protein THTE_4174 [Thermogutta terrifontis]|uniref:Uncharacterized protein n=1 Tax=Thermogutta terrifontis TaxID=1331910 RepID=A0A286RLC1_9BACT|nr:hypothetical protein THTE_4174 [Thermogutta terrifontis]